MSKAGQRIRVCRVSAHSCIAILMSVCAAMSGCSDEKPAGTGGSAGTGGALDGGGTGGTSPQLSLNIDEAARISSPFDATPDPDGNFVYITALDRESGAGVFKVAAGGGAATPLHVGSPFVSPFGIATSSDGKTLYVADPAWESEDGASTGQIFALSASGGSPAAVAGTAGLSARGLEVFDENGKDQIIFSGREKDGSAGVFKVAATGGNVTRLSEGVALSDPSGIAVGKAGEIYVADTRSSGARSASIVLIKAGASSEISSDVPVGYPVGIALTKDDKTLMVSGLDRATLTDVVYAVDVASKSVSTFVGSDSIKINQFEEPAGVHRAKNGNVFAWADSNANGGGTVYVIGK